MVFFYLRFGDLLGDALAKGLGFDPDGCEPFAGAEVMFMLDFR